MAVRNTAEKIRVFIGTEPKTEIARRVLECSIIRRTEMKVDFVPMIGKDWEYSTQGIQVGTGFSLRRWMIPAYCNWTGRAIYLDADQLVFGDIWDLWTKPEQLGKPHQSTYCTYQPDKFSKEPWPQTSVMVINCDAAKQEWGWQLTQVLDYLRKSPSREVYTNFMHLIADKKWWTTQPPGQIETPWNHLCAFQPGKTKLLHYTKEPEQPWYKPDHPLAAQWKLELSVAISAGYVTEDMLNAALARWDVKEDWRPTNGLHPDYDRFRPSVSASKNGNILAKRKKPATQEKA